MDFFIGSQFISVMLPMSIVVAKGLRSVKKKISNTVKISSTIKMHSSLYNAFSFLHQRYSLFNGISRNSHSVKSGRHAMLSIIKSSAWSLIFVFFYRSFDENNSRTQSVNI